MADWFVDDAAVDNTGTGAWDDPLKYLWVDDASTNNGLFNLVTPPAAGDTVYCLDGHVEDNPAGQLHLTNNGTYDNPINIINVASFNSGSPVTLGADAGCRVGHTVAASGSDVYVYANLSCIGIHVAAGDEIKVAAQNGFYGLKMEGCRLEQLRVGAYLINIGSSSTGSTKSIYKRTEFKFVGNGRIALSGQADLIDCTNTVVGTPTSIFYAANNGCVLNVVGGDYSSSGAVPVFDSAGDAEASCVNISDTKLDISATAALAELHLATIIKIHNSGGLTTGNGLLMHAYNAGDIFSETTNVRTGGAQLDGSGYALEFAPSTKINAMNPLVFDQIEIPADFSTSKTVDLFIANATRDLTDKEIFIEWSYPEFNAAGHKLISSRSSNSELVPVTITDDTVSTWGAGLTFTQKITVMIGGATDGREGVLRGRVVLTTDVNTFVDPKPVIT